MGSEAAVVAIAIGASTSPNRGNRIKYLNFFTTDSSKFAGKMMILADRTLSACRGLDLRAYCDI